MKHSGCKSCVFTLGSLRARVKSIYILSTLWSLNKSLTIKVVIFMEPTPPKSLSAFLEFKLHMPIGDFFSQEEFEGPYFLNLTMAFSDHDSCLHTVITENL